MTLTELAELVRHVDLKPEDEKAVTRLRAQLRASDSNELMKLEIFGLYFFDPPPAPSKKTDRCNCSTAAQGQMA